MNARHKWQRTLPLVALLAALVPALSVSLSPRRAALLAAPTAQVRVPFRAGETLDYRVAWAAFSSAASLELTVPERRDLFGRQTWHLRATGHTVNTVRSLFAIDDESDSYSDVATLESRQYEIHLNDLGKKEDQIVHFAPTGQASRAPAPVVMVPPGTYDPLGALYALRGVDWQGTPEFRIPVCDGHDVYQMAAKVAAFGESVTVDKGTFTTTHISIRVFETSGKELPENHFDMWLAADPTRTPVKMQAQLPIGTLRVQLTSATQ